MKEIRREYLLCGDKKQTHEEEIRRLEPNCRGTLAMSDRLEESQRYSFAEPVDIPQVLESSHTEFLDIDKTRAVVIYSEAILDIESGETPLSAAQTIDIDVFEPPTNVEEGDEGAIETIIEQFLDQLVTVSETSATRIE